MARALFQIARGVTTSSLSNGELYYNQTSQSLQLGSNSNSIITLAKLNETNSGSFKVSGDVTIGGTITIGDNTSDNLVVNADLSSSIIPNNDNSFDLGSTSFKYRAIYGTDIYGAINSTNGVISGSSQIATLGFVTTSSLTIVSASAWGAFQSASSYSSSFYTTINTGITNTTTISASAWGAFQSASSYSSSFSSSLSAVSASIYIRDANQDTNITTNSASAWGAFQSASSYSGSFYTTINNTTASVLINSQSAWGAFQSASSYSSSFSSSLSAASGALQTSILNISTSVSNLSIAAGANTAADNTFTGNNTFTKYITGSISGAVDGIDVRALSASLNTRVTDATNEQYLGGFATTGSNTFTGNQTINASISASGNISASNLYITNTIYAYELHTIIESSSVIFSSGSNNFGDQQSDVLTITGSLYQTGSTSFSELSGSLFDFSSSLNSRIGTISVGTLSSSIYQTDATQSNNILIISASAWGAFQSASSYSSSFSSSLNNVSSSFVTSISASNYNITNNSSSFATSISASNAAATSYSASANTTYAKLAVENTFTQNQIISGSLNVTGDVVAYTTSDERLKDNIELISNPIEKVKQLRGVEFDWNNKSMFKAGKHDYGVIAQDVEKVLPELVKETHTGYLGVDYDKMIGLLIEVVKEQEKRIKELENKIGS